MLITPPPCLCCQKFLWQGGGVINWKPMVVNFFRALCGKMVLNNLNHALNWSMLIIFNHLKIQIELKTLLKRSSPSFSQVGVRKFLRTGNICHGGGRRSFRKWCVVCWHIVGKEGVRQGGSNFLAMVKELVSFCSENPAVGNSPSSPVEEERQQHQATFGQMHCRLLTKV